MSSQSLVLRWVLSLSTALSFTALTLAVGQTKERDSNYETVVGYAVHG